MPPSTLANAQQGECRHGWAYAVFIEIAVPVTAALLYAFIWVASRNLSRAGKILARLVPLGFLVPAMIYFATLSGSRMDVTSQAPPAGSAPQVEAHREEDGRRWPRSRSSVARRRRRHGRGRRPTLSRRAAEEAQAKARALLAPHSPTAASSRNGAASSRSAADRAFGRGARRDPPLRSRRRRRTGVPAQPESEWDVVPVFYGTDRARKEEAKRIGYTGARARRLELGRALITVPKSHQVPNIERPFAIRVPFTNVTIYQQAEDPKQHFTIRELKSLTREEFLALVRERIGGSTSFKDQAVVFVHGYNTSFDYALFRTAQMAYDLKFDGASFLYSWPSGAGFTGYGYDRESSEQAEPYLREYIELVVRETGAKSVSVIAHSMGNMPLLRVLQSLGPSLPPGVQLNQIILAAPDVDRNLFEYLAANIKQYGRGMTSTARPTTGRWRRRGGSRAACPVLAMCRPRGRSCSPASIPST